MLQTYPRGSLFSNPLTHVHTTIVVYHSQPSHLLNLLQSLKANWRRGFSVDLILLCYTTVRQYKLIALNSAACIQVLVGTLYNQNKSSRESWVIEYGARQTKAVLQYRPIFVLRYEKPSVSIYAPLLRYTLRLRKSLASYRVQGFCDAFTLFAYIAVLIKYRQLFKINCGTACLNLEKVC